MVATDELLLRVGGQLFALDQAAVASLGSSFLTKLVADDSPFQPPQDGVYLVDADPECFSLLLHVAKFGPPRGMLQTSYDISKEENPILEQQADFWGVDSLYKGMVTSTVNYVQEEHCHARSS